MWVGASIPFASRTREQRIQFASRTREPASRLLPLMARTSSFEAQLMLLKKRCALCATLCAGPLISKDLDRTAGVETSLRRGSPVRNPMRGTPFTQDLDRGDGFEQDDTSRK